MTFDTTINTLTILAVIGLLVRLWSTSKLLAAIQDSLNKIAAALTNTVGAEFAQDDQGDVSGTHATVGGPNPTAIDILRDIRPKIDTLLSRIDST